MVPSPVPTELQDVTQVEDVIAWALLIMAICIQPGGQRGYSGHFINLPQNVKELATSLPRYPKDLSLVIVKLKVRDNTNIKLNYIDYYLTIRLYKLII